MKQIKYTVCLLFMVYIMAIPLVHVIKYTYKQADRVSDPMLTESEFDLMCHVFKKDETERWLKSRNR